MRIVVLAVLGLGTALFAGSWAQVLQIAGIPVDIVLLVVVAIALIDTSTTPVVFAAYVGILVDAAYSTVVGCGALACTATAAVIFFIAQKADRINLLMVLLAGGGAYLLKNAVMAIIIYAKGIEALSFQILIRSILPGAGISAALIIPTYWLMSRLMHARFMRKRRVLVDDFR